jgi:hypothetical protein
VALAHLTTGELRQVIQATEALGKIHKHVDIMPSEVATKLDTLHADASGYLEDLEARDRRARIAEKSRHVHAVK